jgi:hypothetical protein
MVRRRRNNANFRSPEPEPEPHELRFRSKVGIIFVHSLFFIFLISGVIFIVEHIGESSLEKHAAVIFFTAIATPSYVAIYIYCFYERFLE